jgi:hypothetical protein
VAKSVLFSVLAKILGTFLTQIGAKHIDFIMTCASSGQNGTI